MASCGRDRTTQIFREKDLDLELLQTLDSHTATKTGFLDGTSKMVSISSERTIAIYNSVRKDGLLIAYNLTRFITLKSSPITFASVPNETNMLMVSTADKQLQKYAVDTGRLMGSSRSIDPETGEAGSINSMAIHVTDGPTSRRVLLGFCSSDKSIRIHDYESGLLLARQSGLSAISDIKLITSDVWNVNPVTHVISSSLNGTVVVWEMSSSTPCVNRSPQSLCHYESPSNRGKPLRRVLSKTRILDVQCNPRNHDGVADGSRSSPTRLQQMSSRHPLHSASPALSDVNNSNHHENSQNPVTPQTSRLEEAHPKSNRLPVESGKGRNDLIELNSELKQAKILLQGLGKRVASCAESSVDKTVGQDLCSELHHFRETLISKIGLRNLSTGSAQDENLDEYLTRLIEQKFIVQRRSIGPMESNFRSIGD